MKNFELSDDLVLSHRFRRWGYAVLIAALPVTLLVFSLLLILLSEPWDGLRNWFLYTFHALVSVGMYLILFSAEKEEDELFLNLRMKATMHGIRFVFFAVLLLPVFSNIFHLLFLREQNLELPNVGGNMAVVTLLLLYANGSYYLLKRKITE